MADKIRSLEAAAGSSDRYLAGTYEPTASGLPSSKSGFCRPIRPIRKVRVQVGKKKFKAHRRINLP